MNKASLSLGFVFDHPLSHDLRPLERLLQLPVGGSTVAGLVEVQSMLPQATQQWSRHTRYNWKRLSRAIENGQMVAVGVNRSLPRPSATKLGILAETLAPKDADSIRIERALSFRYKGNMDIGADVLGGNEAVDRLTEGILECWMSRIELRAGVVVADASLDDAEAIAICSGGMPGTDLDRRTRLLASARHDWGANAREPEWGTYLTRAHADAIGGTDAIRDAVQPHRVLEANGTVFVQLTPYEEALLPVTEEKRHRLENLMRPILAGPLSRE